MEFSQTGIDLLKSVEGFRSTVYKDAAGKATIGYGHLIVKGDGVAPGDIIDPVKGQELLVRDVQKAVDCVNGCVISNINQNQFDALVIFAYNVGTNALQSSSLLGRLNVGDYDGASQQFLAWDKVHTAQGAFIELAGLKNRRLKEQALFDTDMPPEDTATA